MEVHTPDAAPRFQKGTVGALTGAWPLVAATIWLAIAIGLGAQDGVRSTSEDAGTILILLATMAGVAGAVAWARLPPRTEGASPFVGLAASVAAILALTTIETLGQRASLVVFLLQAPWHYALVPVAVHFGLAIGWPHRRRRWFGLVAGWYLLHIAMFAAAAGGLATGEEPLYQMAELTFRQRLLDPVGIAVALLALGLALASPATGHHQRRATGWAFAAIGLGMGPMAFAGWMPLWATPIDGAMTTARLALALVPFLGLAALLALPYTNPHERDLKAHELVHGLLDERDLAAGLRGIAAVLQREFAAEGVMIRLAEPAITEVLGTAPTVMDTRLADDVDIDEERRSLVAPVGRSGDPLGEVRLIAPYAGAFGRREREWLTGFLVPLAPVLRARIREAQQARRLAEQRGDMREAATEVGRLAAGLDLSSSDDTGGIPPEVDASMVLSQLSDSLGGLTRRSEDLETLADQARTRVREANDEVALALDSLRTLAADLQRLTAARDDIATSNLAVSGVAFRTNLLANNAALEATRAGSLGQTFGVLAEEIRRLADLTAASSTAIEQRTEELRHDVQTLSATLDQIRVTLVRAIQDAESGEDAAARVVETAGGVLGWARSLKPAVEEAHAVAARRTARDQRLTAHLRQLIEEQAARRDRVERHRGALARVRAMLERQAGE
jgi:hypothetical protein